MNISTLWKILAGPAIGAVLLLVWMALAPQETAHAASPCGRYVVNCVKKKIDTKQIGRLPVIRPIVNFAPKAKIISPAQGDHFYAPKGTDRSCNRKGVCSEYSVYTVLVGQGIDREDGTLTGSSLTWTVNLVTRGRSSQPGGFPQLVTHPYTVVAGETFPLKLFAYDPVITSYEVILSVTDSRGAVTTDKVNVSVYRDYFGQLRTSPCDNPSTAAWARQYGICE